MKELTTKQEELLGGAIIKLLNLKIVEGDRVMTNEYGTKTALGLGRVILRLIDELPDEN